MADPLTSSLLDTHEERKGGTSYSLYPEPSTDSSLFKRLLSSRRHLVIFAAVSLVLALAILIPFVASATGKEEPVPPSFDSSSSGMAPPPDMGSSSSSQAGGIYTVNLTIAGMFVTQHGTGDRVVVVMPNVFGIGADLWNLSMSYALAGYRSYAVDSVYGEPMPRQGGPLQVDWWARHLYNKTVASMQGVVDAIRNDTTVRSIQAVGFCYGGGVAVGMLSMQRPLKAAVSVHPTWLNNGINTLGNLTTTISGEVFFIMPTDDPFFNDQADQWIMAMWRRRVGSQFTIYPDTGHGFAFDLPTRPHVAEMRAKSIRDTIHWLNEHDNVR